jgi:hypothetical protein
MNKIARGFIFILFIFLSSCFFCKKKKTNVVSKKPLYSYYIYDSIIYYKELMNFKNRLSLRNNSSHSNEIIRTDSIVIRYNRNGFEILDTIKNPFINE